MRPDIAVILPDLRIGGAERVAVNLSNEFAARGLRVDLVLLEGKGEFLPMVDRRVQIVDLSAPHAIGALMPLVRYLRRASPLAVLAMMWPLTTIVVLAKAMARVSSRLVLSEHTTWSGAPEYQKPLLRLLLRGTLFLSTRWADATLCVSKAAAADLERVAMLPRGKVRAIYNPVRRNTRPSQVAREGVPSPVQLSKRTILAVGNLSRMKNYPLMIKAFSNLVASGEDACLIILGEGPERIAMERLIDEYGVTGKVEMPGMVLDVDHYYEKSDVLALSSDVEGFANVIVEALSHGVQVVSTDCRSGPREILCGGKYGRLVPTGSVEDFANGLRGALCDPIEPGLLIRRAADFSVERITDKYVHVLLPGKC